MEVPEETKGDSGKQTTKKFPPSKAFPERCNGRTYVKHRLTGAIVEVEFEADVLHVSDAYIDVGLLLVKGPMKPVQQRRAGGLRGWAYSLQKKQVSFLPLSLSSDLVAPAEGTEILAVGHGLFGPNTPWIGPSIARGHISKVTQGDLTRRPAVIQTSAAVHRGCSGGALVDVKSGSLVGLITTNVKHQDGTVMPDINFSLPVLLLAPLRDFLTTSDLRQDVPALVAAWGKCAADEQERALWRLEPEYFQLPSRVEQRRRDAESRMQMLMDAAAEAETGKKVGSDSSATKDLPRAERHARERVEPPPRSAL